MTAVYALIIAGGDGQRLGGVRKGDLRVGGVRQIDRVRAALGEVVEPILVATGPAGRAIALPDHACAVPDLDAPCAGPLAGLAAAVAHLAESGVTRGLLVSAAVDTPFLPADFVPRLIAGLGAAPGAYAAWGEDFYPPNSIWRLEALQALPRDIAQAGAPPSLKALQRVLGAQKVDWADASDGDPFANINTIGDLLALQRIALN
jgi:molybdenum cofactor guanylyltransferase